MATISAADIKKLREATGAGMTDCKNALVESDGDYEKAVEYLRVKGLKGVAKREGRAASNGLVTVKADGTTKATLLELNCETDFVAKSEKYIALADRVVTAAAASGANDPKEITVDGADLQTVLDEANANLGEKIEVRRVATFEGALRRRLPAQDQPRPAPAARCPGRAVGRQRRRRQGRRAAHRRLRAAVRDAGRGRPRTPSPRSARSPAPPRSRRASPRLRSTRSSRAG